VPWKLPYTPVGTPMRSIAARTASVACESDTSAARLKEMVVAANWLWCCTLSGVLVVS
jgi:hypothetical protein